MQIFPKSKFTWVLVLFMLYVYYNEYLVNHEAPVNTNTTDIEVQKRSEDNTQQPAQQQAEQESLTNKLVNKIQSSETGKVILDALVKKSIEDKYGKDDIKIIAARKNNALTVVDVIKGEGGVLNCGAKAVINYEAFMASGIKFDATKLQDASAPITIQLGKKQVIKGLEAGIVGMREGGRRKISIPPELAFSAPGFINNLLSKDEVILYDVELVQIKDGPYKTDMTTNIVNESEGTGREILCGDNVKIKYSINDAVSGAPIESATGEAEFILGNGTVPLGFELSVIDMKTGGKRTTVFPNKLLKTAGKSDFINKSKINKDNPIRLDIEVLQAADK